jgi:hypothetical protein
LRVTATEKGAAAESAIKIAFVEAVSSRNKKPDAEAADNGHSRFASLIVKGHQLHILFDHRNLLPHLAKCS